MWQLQHLTEHLLTFTLVLVRVSGLFVTAPIFGTSDVPARVRAFLAFALAVLVAPMQWKTPVANPGNMVNMLVLVGNELLIGAVLGLGIMLLLSGVQIAGQVIGQMSGMQLADVFSPGLDTSMPIFSHLLFQLALVVFVILGGHRMMMEALLDSFTAMPPGTAGFSRTLTETLTTLLAQSFSLGVRAAAPAMAALLLATLVLGLISRTLPQLNIMALGFGLNSFVTLGVLSVSLGAVAWLFSEQVAPVIEMLTESLKIAPA